MGKTSKDKRDIYYRMAKQEGWRARSAFKLKQIDDMFGIFEGVHRVVDLCAAPGSWSQVVSKELFLKEQSEEDRARVRIVAVDLQPMSPLPGVIQIQGDITEISTAEKIIGYFDGAKANLVICDGAPDECFSDWTTRIRRISAKPAGFLGWLLKMRRINDNQCYYEAFNITSHVLEIGGTFVSKIFRAKNVALMYAQMRMFFKDVHCAKPRSSRQSSCEAFIVCKGYSPPEGYEPNLSNPVLAQNYDEAVNELTGINQTLVPFMACGDLTGFGRLNEFDSDRTYPLDLSTISDDFKDWDYYTHHAPTQPPTEPAYLKAVELKRTGRLAKCEADSKSQSTSSESKTKKNASEIGGESTKKSFGVDFIDELGRLLIDE